MGNAGTFTHNHIGYINNFVNHLHIQAAINIVKIVSFVNQTKEFYDLYHPKIPFCSNGATSDSNYCFEDKCFYCSNCREGGSIYCWKHKS